MALIVIMTLCPWHWTTVLCYDYLHIYYQQICFLTFIYPYILSLWISACSQHDALHFFHCFHLGSQVFTNLANYPLLFKYSPFLTTFHLRPSYHLHHKWFASVGPSVICTAYMISLYYVGLTEWLIVSTGSLFLVKKMPFCCDIIEWITAVLKFISDFA